MDSDEPAVGRRKTTSSYDGTVARGHRDTHTDERMASVAPGTFSTWRRCVFATATLDRLAQLYPQGRFVDHREAPDESLPASGAAAWSVVGVSR
jgi:hypothetical protein